MNGNNRILGAYTFAHTHANACTCTQSFTNWLQDFYRCSMIWSLCMNEICSQNVTFPGQCVSPFLPRVSPKFIFVQPKSWQFHISAVTVVPFDCYKEKRSQFCQWANRSQTCLFTYVCSVVICKTSNWSNGLSVFFNIWKESLFCFSFYHPPSAPPSSHHRL